MGPGLPPHQPVALHQPAPLLAPAPPVHREPVPQPSNQRVVDIERENFKYDPTVTPASLPLTGNIAHHSPAVIPAPAPVHFSNIHPLPAISPNFGRQGILHPISLVEDHPFLRGALERKRIPSQGPAAGQPQLRALGPRLGDVDLHIAADRYRYNPTLVQVHGSSRR